MKLHGEEGLKFVNNTFVGHIVRVGEERLPAVGERVVVDGETMILGRNVALGRPQVDAGLVHAAVAVLHLVRLGARSESEKLVAEADAEDGLGIFLGEHLFDLLDCGSCHLGISRPVGDEQSIVLALLGIDVVVEGHNDELDF